jgi:hypothetical protein
MKHEFTEDIAAKLFNQDEQLGFCKHDLSAEAMHNIIALVLTEATDQIEAGFINRPSTELYTGKQVVQNIRGLLATGDANNGST